MNKGQINQQDFEYDKRKSKLASECLVRLNTKPWEYKKRTEKQQIVE